MTVFLLQFDHRFHDRHVRGHRSTRNRGEGKLFRFPPPLAGFQVSPEVADPDEKAARIRDAFEKVNYLPRPARMAGS